MKNRDNYELDIVRQIRRGDKEAFRSIIDDYAPLVFSIVRKFEKDDDMAEELAEQIFLKTYDKLESFGFDASFSSWLYSLALNHCRDYSKNIRRKNQRLEDTLKEQPDIMNSEESNPEHMYIHKESNHLLQVALSKLSKEHAQPLIMKYRDGISYDVISEQLNVSVSALKVRVYRAKKELKKIMESLS